MQPTTIVVCDSFGEYLLTPDEGEELLAVVHAALAEQRDITLDFAGVLVVSSAFLNFAIGRLYEDIPADVVEAHLRAINLTDTGELTLKAVMENSKEYYSNKRFRDAVDAAVDVPPEADQ